MRIKKSFGLSVVVHLLLVGFITLLAMPNLEIEEKIVLELAMNTSSDTPKPISKSTMAPAIPTQPHTKSQHKRENTKSVLPIDPQANVTESIVEQPKSEVTPVVQKVSQTTQSDVLQKIEPIAQQMPRAPDPKPSVEEEYLDNHLGAIRDILVKYRKYPNQAVRLKQEGITRVSFRLKSNGEVDDIVIQSSSGYIILDDDAKILIQKSAQYFPKPPKTVRITVPLKYSLKTAV